MGTCAFYGDFKLAGMQVKKQYLDFFGTTTTDENDKPIGFVNNWAIGIKGSYDKPDSGISEIVSDNAETVADDAPVYSITGQLVGVKADIDRLPAGLYICSGKKYLVR